MSLEETLAAILRAEVDKRIAQVQAAADAWVAQFAASAAALAAGEVQALPAPIYQPALSSVLASSAAPVETMPAHMRPPGIEEDRMPSFITTDSAAARSNMSI